MPKGKSLSVQLTNQSSELQNIDLHQICMRITPEMYLSMLEYITKQEDQNKKVTKASILLYCKILVYLKRIQKTKINKRIELRDLYIEMLSQSRLGHGVPIFSCFIESIYLIDLPTFMKLVRKGNKYVNESIFQQNYKHYLLLMISFISEALQRNMISYTDQYRRMYNCAKSKSHLSMALKTYENAVILSTFKEYESLLQSNKESINSICQFIIKLGINKKITYLKGKIHRLLLMNITNIFRNGKNAQIQYHWKNEISLNANVIRSSIIDNMAIENKNESIKQSNSGKKEHSIFDETLDHAILGEFNPEQDTNLDQSNISEKGLIPQCSIKRYFTRSTKQYFTRSAAVLQLGILNIQPLIGRPKKKI